MSDLQVLRWRAETTLLAGAAEFEGVDMKYVVAWEVRPNVSEDELARSLQIFEEVVTRRGQ